MLEGVAYFDFVIYNIKRYGNWAVWNNTDTLENGVSHLGIHWFIWSS